MEGTLELPVPGTEEEKVSIAFRLKRLSAHLHPRGGPQYGVHVAIAFRLKRLSAPVHDGDLPRLRRRAVSIAFRLKRLSALAIEKAWWDLLVGQVSIAFRLKRLSAPVPGTGSSSVPST